MHRNLSFMPRLCAAVCLAGWGISSVFAAETTIQASKDNTLYEDAGGTLSNGAGQYFFAGAVGPTGSGDLRRGLVAFDVAGAIPAGSIITQASLRLTMTKTNGGSVAVAVHRAMANWGEGDSLAPGEEGAGAPAATNDATWTHRFFNTLTWTTPGGDFAAVASATQTVAGNANYTWSSAGLLADVQSWFNDPSSNFGWVIIGDEIVLSSAKRFASRQNTDANIRPALTVTYEVSSAVRDWTLY